MTLIACRDWAAIQRLKPSEQGRLECARCGRVLENRTGRRLDRALACVIAVLLLLIPANTLPLMTVHLGPVTSSKVLASGLCIAWAQGWPLVRIVLALEAVILPFLRFGLLSVTLAAIRSSHHDRWVGRAFRYSEMLDLWAMTDVLLIGAGIGYGRLAAQTSVTIDAGGWCFVCVAVMTMITRGTLEASGSLAQIGTGTFGRTVLGHRLHRMRPAAARCRRWQALSALLRKGSSAASGLVEHMLRAADRHCRLDAARLWLPDE